MGERLITAVAFVFWLPLWLAGATDETNEHEEHD